MRHIFFIAMLTALFSVHQILAEDAVKTDVPSTGVVNQKSAPSVNGSQIIPAASKIAETEKFIRDLFQSDYAKTDVTSRIALTKKLLEQADENKNDPVSVYVLLRDARDFAVGVGDLELATTAQKRLRETFSFDFAAMLADFKHLLTSTKTEGAATAMTTLLIAAVDDALEVENFEQAARFSSQIDDLLPLIKDATLKTRLKAVSANAQALKRDSGAAEAALKILATKPDDPEASITAAKFALQRGKFETAFTLLAKSKDATLSDLGKRELTPPTDIIEQMKLGDGWFERAEKEVSANAKVHMLARAAFWYSKALPTASGLAKLKLERRIAMAGISIPVATGSTAAAGNKIDLLKLIDPSKDAVNGTWIFSGTQLISDKSRFGRIEIPYIPPEEYDFRIAFKRTSGRDLVGQILSKSGSQFCWIMGGLSDTASGIDRVNGKPYNENESFVSKKLIINNQVHTSVVQVRKTGVTILFDGKQVSKLSTTYENLKLVPELGLRNTSLLGLGEFESRVEFSVVELIEITGIGKKTR